MKFKTKIYTSFVSPLTLKTFEEENILPFFIIRSIWKSSLIGKYSKTPVHLPFWTPSHDLLSDFKDGQIDIETFQKKFAIEMASTPLQEYLERIERLSTLTQAKGAVLLGYGTNNLMDYRSGLAAILNNSGLLDWKVKEIVI